MITNFLKNWIADIVVDVSKSLGLTKNNISMRADDKVFEATIKFGDGKEYVYYISAVEDRNGQVIFIDRIDGKGSTKECRTKSQVIDFLTADIKTGLVTETTDEMDESTEYFTKENLYNRLIHGAGFNKEDIDKFFSIYSLKDWLICLNNGSTNVYRLGKKIKSLTDEKNESMDFSEAKQILNESGYQLIDEALEGPATSKQLWTLFKLTKKDYRGQDLSKEDAFKMIGELLKNKDKKVVEPKNKKVKIAQDDSNSPVKIGEIYHRSWGYSKCINTYFKVLGVKGKKARVVELDKKAVSGSLMQGRVVPVETPRSNAEETIAMIKDDGTLRIKLYSNYETYRKWDGQSDFEDHMD